MITPNEPPCRSQLMGLLRSSVFLLFSTKRQSNFELFFEFYRILQLLLSPKLGQFYYFIQHNMDLAHAWMTV